MISPKRIAFVLALTSALLVSAFCFATLNQSPAAASTNPQVIKVLRRKDQKHGKPTVEETAFHRSNLQQDREVETKIPKHVPIKIRLKPDKEKTFKNLDNSEWYREFELEVTNTGDKPIYYLDLWLVYSGVISDSGKRVGAVLRYGRIDFVDFNTRPLPSDVPILPGATISLKIPEADQRGWTAHKIREKRQDPKKVEISFTQLSFGDGTGFNGSDALQYPYKNDQSLTEVAAQRPNS
jgi:hypothetical protein